MEETMRHVQRTRGAITQLQIRRRLIGKEFCDTPTEPNSFFRVRNANLDTVRGIACVLLVVYHVIGASSASGLHLPSDSGYHAFNEMLGYVRMPLFTFLSGIVYALRPVSSGAGRQFVEGKLKRLLLPFIFVSLIFAVVQKLVPGTNGSLEWAQIPRVLVWPYGHMWFIPALLLVFALIGTLDYLRALDKPLHLLALFVLACVLFEEGSGEIGILAARQALFLLPFFVAGVMLKRFGWQWVMACVLAGAIALSWKISLGVGFGVALVAMMPKIPLIARVGVYSYSIYLYHVFGSAFSRIAWDKLGGLETPLLLLSGTLAGLIVPITIHIALERLPYASWALLGVRPKRAKANNLKLTEALQTMP